MNTKNRYFGMTIPQIGLLVSLALIACIVFIVFGVIVVNNSSAPVEPLPTKVLPTATSSPIPTATLWPTITPIPDWVGYTFSNEQATIWLPTSYSGADTNTSSEEIMQNVRASYNNEAFANDIQGLINTPGITFFAYDLDFIESARFMYVWSEALDPAIPLTMDLYLNSMMEDVSGGNDRVVERQITQLDHTEIGILVVESKVPAGELDTFVSTANYLIQGDDTMWIITFRIGRDELKDIKETINITVSSFSFLR